MTTPAPIVLRPSRRRSSPARARFWLAEDYHQKYCLRHDALLMRELAAYTPRQLVDSTVAARLNGSSRAAARWLSCKRSCRRSASRRRQGHISSGSSGGQHEIVS